MEVEQREQVHIFSMVKGLFIWSRYTSVATNSRIHIHCKSRASVFSLYAELQSFCFAGCFLCTVFQQPKGFSKSLFCSFLARRNQKHSQRLTRAKQNLIVISSTSFPIPVSPYLEEQTCISSGCLKKVY